MLQLVDDDDLKEIEAKVKIIIRKAFAVGVVFGIIVSLIIGYLVIK